MIKEILFGGSGTSTRLGDIGLLLARIFIGLSMAIAHGLPKLQDPSGIIKGTTAMGFPLPIAFAWAAILAEFLGGIMLALGLLTRPSAFLIASTMGVAAFVAHASDPFKSKELAMAYLFAGILFICTGGGRFSIDKLIK